MKIPSKWIIATVAVLMMAITWLDNDFSAYQRLSLTELVPVICVTAVIFLLKMGVLSAVLIGLKELWKRIRKE